MISQPVSDQQGRRPRPRRRPVLSVLTASALFAVAPAALPASATETEHHLPTSVTSTAVPRLQDIPATERLVPMPTSVRDLPGRDFRLRQGTRIVVAGDAEAVEIATDLAEKLRASTGLPLRLVRGERARYGAIVLRVRPASELPGVTGPEAYQLSVRTSHVLLEASTAQGLFRGLQTLRQLLPPQVESMTRQEGPWTVPAVQIVDSPRFAYRGAMLDVARHFLTVDEVKRYIDDIALYKMNTLHLHLSDDQGWRIEIEGWPQLTRYGGTTEVAGGPGGWYTQSDYAEIVQYAAQRFITVVPEIDTPGHTNAALAAYPELTCEGQAPPLYTGIEVGFSSLCIDKEVTYKFLDDVIGQLARLTPGPYLHIGGDEAHSTEEADYVRFIERVEKIVQKHGKQMMGWAEISAADLSETSVAQYWNPASGSDPGTQSATAAVAQGVRLVMSPANKAYLDMKYTALTPLGLQWAGLVEVSDSYNWDPATYISGVRESDVLGVEAPVWTETLKDLDDVEYMAFPRLPGIAEKGWSAAEGRSWEEYRVRLAAQSARWEVLDINYYCSPQVDWAYCRTRPVAPKAQ
jgi:hexosaminidase